MCCPNALIASVTAAAALLAEGRESDEIALLGAVFTQLGDTLVTIAATKDRCETIEKIKSA